MADYASTLNLEGAAMRALVTEHDAGALEPGWALSAAMPHHEGGVLLVVTQAMSRVTLGLQVRVRDDASPAWLRTPHLDLISHLPGDMPEAQGLALLRPLADTLIALDGPETSLSVPPSLGDVAPKVESISLPHSLRTHAQSPFDFGPVFVLDLSSDCGQRCSFCSTRAKFSPELNPSAASTERKKARMAGALREGYRTLRLSGLDPLTHPDVFALIRYASDLGYEKIHIYSPFRTMAEREARRALYDALGSTPVTLHVPVYGPDAETHERVTGVVGSFEAVTAALQGFFDEGLGASVNLLTVITKQNLPRAIELSRWLGTWRAPIQVFLPFPTTRAQDDAFFEVATSHEELVRALASCDPQMGLSELLPCVRYRHELQSGTPTLSVGGFHPMSALLGTLFEHADYRRVEDKGGNTFTIPVRRCPHEKTCALSRVCPKAVYAAYAEVFGLSEMQPVSPSELMALSPELGAFIRPA